MAFRRTKFLYFWKIQLIEGRHILDNDIHKVILCKDLAEKNNLNLGDSLIVTNENGKQLSFEIIGLFHAQKLEKLENQSQHMIRYKT